MGQRTVSSGKDQAVGDQRHGGCWKSESVGENSLWKTVSTYITQDQPICGFF